MVIGIIRDRHTRQSSGRGDRVGGEAGAGMHRSAEDSITVPHLQVGEQCEGGRGSSQQVQRSSSGDPVQKHRTTPPQDARHGRQGGVDLDSVW